MITNKNSFSNTVFWSFILLFFLLNLVLLKEMSNQRKYTELTLISNRQLTIEQVNKLTEKNQQNSKRVSMLFWSKRQKQLLSSQEMGIKELATVYLLTGNSQIMFPKTQGIDIGDKDRGLISSSLAIKLFGHSQVTDFWVKYQEKNYQIAAVITSKEEFFVCQLQPMDSVKLSNVTLLSTSIVNKALLIKKFTSEFSLAVERTDYSFFYVLFVIANVSLVLLFISLYGLESYRNKVEIGVSNWSSLSTYQPFILLVILLGLGIYFIRLLGSIKEYLPNRLSDFDFFKGLYQEFEVNLRSLFDNQKNPGEFKFIQQSVLVFFFSSSLTVLGGLELIKVVGDLLFIRSTNRRSNDEETTSLWLRTDFVGWFIRLWSNK